MSDPNFSKKRPNGSGDDRQHGRQHDGGKSSGADKEESIGLPALRSTQRSVRRREYWPEHYPPANHHAEPSIDQPEIDLRKYLWLLFKHRWLIAGSVAVFLCLGLLATFLATPIYRASVTIQINRQAPKVVDFDMLPAPEAGGDIKFYQTQYELLRSRSLAERVVANLGLQDDPAFVRALAPGPWGSLKNLLFGGGAAPSTDNIAARQRAAAAVILERLTVEPVRTSRIVRLSYDSPDAQLAQKIANAIAENFIAVNLERRYESSAYARNFLEERLEQLKVKLEDSEKELVAYAERQKLVNAGDGQTLAMTNLAAANEALAAATTDRMQKELLWQQVSATKSLGLPKILESDAIGKMRGQRVELAAEYQDKLSFFKPAFPDMRQLQARIDELDRQIVAEVALIKESAKAEMTAAVKEEQSLAARVEALKTKVTDFRNRNIRYNILQREVDTNRSLYDGLLQRYKEIGVAGGVGINNVSIIDPAQRPQSAHTPRLSHNIAIALVLGLAFGGGAAFARERLDDTFKSPEDVEDHLGLPLLGVIPLAGDMEDPAGLVDDPRAPMAEAFRSLRTALQFSTADGVPKTLLVTSSRAGEGKSTTALTLARSFALLGMRVLLIDTDLRKPAIHHLLDLDGDTGLTNYLAGPIIPPDIFQRTDLPGLTVMPCGPLPPNPAELLAGPKMLSLLTMAAQKYDLVVLDGPPVGGLADAPLLASITAGTVMMIDASATRRRTAKAALRRLHFARAQMVGAVVNKLDLTTAGYHYGYGYGYTDYSGEQKPLTLMQKILGDG